MQGDGWGDVAKSSSMSATRATAAARRRAMLRMRWSSNPACRHDWPTQGLPLGLYGMHLTESALTQPAAIKSKFELFNSQRSVPTQQHSVAKRRPLTAATVASDLARRAAAAAASSGSARWSSGPA